MRDDRERQVEDEARGQGGRDEPSAVTVGETDEGLEPESVQVSELRAELDSLNDRHLRLAAEFDNYRKRSERDRQAQAARLQLDLVRGLIDVLDDLERVAGAGADVPDGGVLDGVRLVEKKFRAVLEAAGLEALDAEGAEFDPETMEALQTVPTDEPGLDHRVAEVFQRGYRFRDVLVRPARVLVYQYGSTDAGGGEERE